MPFNKPASQVLVAALVVLVGVGRPAVAQDQPRLVCAALDAHEKRMALSVSNGCVSSSVPFEGHDITAEVSQDRATITVDGRFRYGRMKGNIGTTDCAGGQNVAFDVSGAEARRYRVVVNGDHVGVIDLTESTDRTCVRREERSVSAVDARVNHAFSNRRFAEAEFPVTTAPSLMGLLEPIIAGHPEALDGRPSMTIDIRPEASGGELVFEIRMLGYLDDSVSGEEFIGTVGEGGDGWILKSLWRRSLCARGKFAGQWTGENCS